MQQEALFFAEQNGHAAPLTAGIKLRAKVVGEDALSMAFLAATNRVGLDFNYDSLQLSDYRISCVGTALKLYNQMGEKIYCEALRLIVDAWEGKPDSFRAAVLKGVMYFVEVYHGEFSEERLIRALRSVHPMEIYRTGMDNPAKLPGWLSTSSSAGWTFIVDIRSTSRSTSTLLRTSRGSDTSACKTVGHRTSIFKNNETARIGGCRPCACKIRHLADSRCNL